MAYYVRTDVGMQEVRFDEIEHGQRYYKSAYDARYRMNYKTRNKEMTKQMFEKKATLGFVDKIILNTKLRLPRTVTLTDNESAAVIDKWKEQSQKNQDTSAAMIMVSNKTERYLSEVETTIESTQATLTEARKGFKAAKSEAGKVQWARRLVIAGETMSQLNASRKRLKSTVKQVGETIEDARLAKVMLDARIGEAKIYRELNGGLKLVGESLAAARQEHVVSKIEKENFDLTMGALDSSINTKSNESLLTQAKKYLK